MKHTRFALYTWRGLAASALAFCLFGSSTLSTGAGNHRIEAQSGANTNPSHTMELTESSTGHNSVSSPAARMSAAKDGTSPAHISEAYGKLPLSFEANVGQA